MRRTCLGLAVVFTTLATAAMGQQGAYKVLKTAKTGGLGGFDSFARGFASSRRPFPKA